VRCYRPGDTPLGTEDELVSASFVDHTRLPGLPPEREGIEQTIKMLRGAFPDIQVGTEHMIAEGDKVVSRQTSRGTHEGEFRGVPPTGKEVTWTGILIFRIVDGKIVDQWLEQYDIPGRKTDERGIAKGGLVKTAWFKDRGQPNPEQGGNNERRD
jgi:predicted ester cyclase